MVPQVIQDLLNIPFNALFRLERIRIIHHLKHLRMTSSYFGKTALCRVWKLTLKISLEFITLPSTDSHAARMQNVQLLLKNEKRFLGMVFWVFILNFLCTLITNIFTLKFLTFIHGVHYFDKYITNFRRQ